MARFEEKEFLFSDIHGGERYENGDVVDASAINAPIEASVFAQNAAKRAVSIADIALQKINDAVKGEITLSAYPVGSIYMTTVNTDPAELFGGSWERIKDRFLLAAGDKYMAGVSGGSADAVVVSHNHKVIWENGDQEISGYRTGDTSGGSYFNAEYNTAASNKWRILTDNTGVDGTGKNMPPYQVVNVWHRYA